MKPIGPGLSELFRHTDTKSSLFDPNKAKQSKQRRYLQLMRGINMLSYSTINEKFVPCPRLLCCSKLSQNQTINVDDIPTRETNIDFAFGRAIETGVQSTLLGNSKEKVFFDMFMAWDVMLMAEHPKNAAKTFTDAVIAIDQFNYIKREFMEGWEIAMFKGKPAVELAMIIDMGNGYYYVAHADIILWHPQRRLFKVLELKTTGFKNVDEAMYKNSGQGVGYSIFVDEIASNHEVAATFEVDYAVYCTSLGHWKKYSYAKSRSNRADWINTLLLDQQLIDTYRRVSFFPKRGSSCFRWGRRCEYFDSCDLDWNSFNPTGNFAVIGEDELKEHEFDFKFKLSDIIKTQKELIK